MVGKIFDIISDAKSERAKANKEAAKYGVDVNFTPGEFTARSARNSLIESTLGRRFVPQTKYPDLLARGQFSSDPLMGTPTNVRKLPEYQQLANPQERLFNESSYITGKNVPSSGTRGTTSTTGNKPVKVKDAKLGVYLAEVIKSLNATLSSINERLDDAENDVIQAKEGVFGTIKQLEQNSDLLETKLDAIIDALRDQNHLAKLQEDKTEIKDRESEQEIENDLSGTRTVIQPGEEKSDVIQLNLLEDIKESAKEREEQLSLPLMGGPEGFERGGIASGPDSGYLAKLHGDEMIVPLDNNYTQGEPSAVDGKIRKPPMFAERGTPVPPVNENVRPSMSPMNPSIFGKVAAVENQTPDILKDAENLQKAQQFAVQSAGILTMNTMQEAVSNMGGLAGAVAGQLKQISAPIATAFGVTNTITNSLVRENSAEADTEERRKQTKAFTTSDRKAWWDPLGIFTGRGSRGRGGPGTSTGPTNVYNRMRGTGGPGTTYNRGTGGLPGTGTVLKPLTTRNSAGGYETRLETQLHFLGIPVPFTKGRYRGDSGNARYGSLWPLKDADSRSGIERFNQNPDRPYNLVPSYEGSDMVRPEAIPAGSAGGSARTVQPQQGAITGANNTRLNEAIRDAEDIGNRTGTRQLMDSTADYARKTQNRFDVLRQYMRDHNMPGSEENMNIYGKPYGNQSSLGAPSSRGQNIAMLDYSSKEQAMSRLNKQTRQPDPIIINNETATDSGSEASPMSHIANMGDPGLSLLYPSIS